jgi:hypothetical protein
MKLKHNKKRNTAFIFEALTREMTRAVVAKDRKTVVHIKRIMREHFRPGSVLYEELDCYDAMTAKGLDRPTAEKLLFHAKKKHADLDDGEIFEEQSAVIKSVNSTLGKSFFTTFIPNYKEYATLSSIFGNRAPLKTKVILENQILEKLTMPLISEQTSDELDTLVTSEFCNLFNKKYEKLEESQRILLEKYIFSFGPSEADFRLYMGRELQRLHEEVKNSENLDELKEDVEMLRNTQTLLSEIEKFDVSNISEEDVLKILKIQKLVQEYHKE